jgi:hemolysin activation/secretion protein
LIDGWTHRFSVGLRYLKENYSTDPLDPAPPPEDRTLYTPYFHYQVVEDDYRQTENVNSIGRPEYQQLGVQFDADIGQSLRRLGSTQSVTQYAASLSGGTRFSASQTLFAAGAFSGEYADGESDNLLLSGSLTYYQRRRNGALLYLSLQGDATDYSDDAHYLSLGGNTGLRGYPTNYRLGERRVLFTAEQRFYSDWYPFQLIRVGGAVFYDVGRAWGGPWYADAGVGLRLLSARSARGQTLHIDLAFPLHHDPTIKAYQVTIESKTSF